MQGRKGKIWGAKYLSWERKRSNWDATITKEYELFPENTVISVDRLVALVHYQSKKFLFQNFFLICDINKNLSVRNGGK